MPLVSRLTHCRSYARTPSPLVGTLCRHLGAKALILAAYPFFPMGTVFVAPFLILSFKFEKKLLTTFQVQGFLLIVCLGRVYRRNCRINLLRVYKPLSELDMNKARIRVLVAMGVGSHGR